MRPGGSCQRQDEEAFAACQDQVSGDIQPEMLEPQLEIATKPSLELADARSSSQTCDPPSGPSPATSTCSIMASGTHPLAVWSRVRPNTQPRYGKVMHDLQMLGSRTVLCGMHVHVEVPDLEHARGHHEPDPPYLPLLSSATSSPFCRAQRTGLLGYRLAAYRELPRTGFPDLFENEQDYQRYIDTLVAARAVENSSVWWVIRPSLKYPTLGCAWPIAAPGSTTPSRSRLSSPPRATPEPGHHAERRADRRLARHQ